MPNKRLLIVDDSVTIRAMIEAIFDRRSLDIRIVGIVGDGEQALDVISVKRPDVVTLDINMPGMDGLAVLGAIMRNRPVAVVIVSSTATVGSKVCRDALSLGASTCFDKSRIVREADLFAKAVMTARPGKVLDVGDGHLHTG